MPIIGGIGDILSLITLVRDVATALDGRGSKAEYQEVQNELKGLEEALLPYHQLLQARCDDPTLNAIFTSSENRAADCRRCIEVFSKQAVKFDKSLGIGQGGNIYRDATMKVRWGMSKKEEVARFRAEVARHTSSIHMLLGMANMSMQRINQETLERKLETLDDKLEEAFKTQEELITKVQDTVESGNNRTDVVLAAIKSDLKPGWVQQLGNEVKGMVLQIFTTTRTTLSAVQRIEERLPNRSEQLLIRTFVLEDVLGRITHVDMDYVNSWDAFDGMLALCFLGLPGHKKVAKKDYVIQDQKTSRELQRSVPWSGAFLPGQRIIMGLIFRKRLQKAESSFCPGCHILLKERHGQISCKCGMSHERRTQILEVEEEDTSIFDLPDDEPSGDSYPPTDSPPEPPGTPPESSANDENQSSETHDLVDYESISCFKRVIVIEVEVNLIETPQDSSDDEIIVISDDETEYSYTTPPRDTAYYYGYKPYTSQPQDPCYYHPCASPSPVGSPGESGYGYRTPPRHHTRYIYPGCTCRYSPPRGAFSPRYDSNGYYASAANMSRKKSSWASTPRYESKRRQRYRPSYEDSDEDESQYVDYVVDGVTHRIPARSKYSQYYYPQASQGSTDDASNISDHLPPRRRRQSSSTPQRPNTSSPKKPMYTTPKATEADARKHRIPPGYSLKNWDPSEEPIMLLGSVFDANSLGKWIYDWTVYQHGPATPVSDMAGELWLLLIQLAGKAKRAEECMPRIRTHENKEMVEDFIESGERFTDKLKKLLKSCETPMLKAGKKHGKDSEQLGKNAGTEFVDSVFGRDRQLDATEKFMAGLRLWNLRFDANCEDILRRPGQ